MTPNFALSLSFDGIRLLHRVQGGWHLVGEVALDDADLKGALAVLRKSALMLEPGGLRTKLLIPPEQIKFATIETAQTSLEDVHGALDGATPYAIDDLVIDFDRTGGRTHIAAVARETLDEAQAFAREHGFNPVAFVAIAEPFTFQSEVFFGPVKGLDPAEMPERDTEPVKVIGAATLPDPEPVEEAAPVVAVAAPGPAEAAQVDVAPDVAPEPEPAPEVVFASRSRGGKSLPPQDRPKAETVPPVTAPASEEDVAATPEIEPLFTRRKEAPPPVVPVAETAGPAVASPVLDLPGKPPKPVVVDTPEPVDAPALTGKPEDAAKTDTSFATVRAVPEAPADKVVTAPPKPTPAKTRTTALDKAAEDRGKPRFLALKLTAGLLVFLFLIALWANTWSEEGLAWLWGGDDPETAITEAPAEVVPAPETLPVIAQDVPEATPAPSALAPVDDTPVEAAEAPPLPVVRAPAGRVLSPAEADRIYAATGVYQRAPRFPLEPQIATLDGLRESAIVTAAERPEQLTLPATDALFRDLPLDAPRNPPPPGTVYQRDLRGFILATADGVMTPDGALVIAGAPALQPPLRPGTEIIAAPDPSPVAANGEGLILVAGRPPVVPPLRPEGLIPQEAEAPEVPGVPDTLETEVADAPAEVTEAEAEAETEVAEVAPEPTTETGPEDTPEEGLVLIAGRPDIVPPLRPEGLAPATAAPADDATAPVSEASPVEEGLIVITGAPDLRPPLRPESFADLAPADEAAIEATITEVVSTAGGVSLAGLRPSLRPEDAVAAVIPAPVFADPALAGFRPSLRPAGLAPAAEPEPEPETPDISDVVAAIAEAAPPSAFVTVTPRAVRVSARPDTRPRNFARVVAAAEQRSARQQSAAAATVAAAPTQQVRTAPATPSGPTATTVARAATADNAIRLRDINLIGVYGRPGDRRALVRMGNGRFVKVEVGSSLDGGRVTAIGDSALNYVKRGRTYALQLPQG
ncbi:hypothetical protein AB3Y40_10655 [Yoonia sp. R2331]|uniref:hypothetical protein n=1 Tax=Yoonia sp. R2331 TaxID=3237238 RepID=UPI0034E42F5E